MKIKKLISAVLIVACLSLAAMVFTACGGTDIKSISIDTVDAHLVFEVGKTFNTDGLKVTGKQADGKNVRIAAENYTVSAPDISTVGEKTVTITHKELTATYKINVVVREVTVTFTGNITCGYSAGNYVIYPMEFRCYNTLDWELWYRAQTTVSGFPTPDKTSPTLGTRTIRLRTTGRYKVANGVYTMVLALETVTTTNNAGVISFNFQDPSLPYTEYEDGRANQKGIFYGVLTLAT